MIITDMVAVAPYSPKTSSAKIADLLKILKKAKSKAKTFKTKTARGTLTDEEEALSKIAADLIALFENATTMVAQIKVQVFMMNIEKYKEIFNAGRLEHLDITYLDLMALIYDQKESLFWAHMAFLNKYGIKLIGALDSISIDEVAALADDGVYMLGSYGDMLAIDDREKLQATIDQNIKIVAPAIAEEMLQRPLAEYFLSKLPKRVRTKIGRVAIPSDLHNPLSVIEKTIQATNDNAQAQELISNLHAAIHVDDTGKKRL